MIERPALVALVLGGCAIVGCQNALEMSGDHPAGNGHDPARELLVEASTLRVRGVDFVASASDATYSPASPPGSCQTSAAASVRLDSYADGSWVMSRLRVGNLDLFEAPAGTYSAGGFVFDGHTSSTEYSTRGTLYLSVRSSSGSRYGEESSSDTDASDASVILSDNDDGSRTLTFGARYRDSGRVAAGTIVYRDTEVAPEPTAEIAPALTRTTAVQAGSHLRQQHVPGTIYDGR
ncbi:MAG: hypothetical protein IT379_28600 [Deltaproteobacteria bacterium]|nr:hypothetical protein [Deltaproteobacteria bacterium]